MVHFKPLGLSRDLRDLKVGLERESKNVGGLGVFLLRSGWVQLDILIVSEEGGTLTMEIRYKRTITVRSFFGL